MSGDYWGEQRVADAEFAANVTYWCRTEDHLRCGGECSHLDRGPTECWCFCHEPELEWQS